MMGLSINSFILNIRKRSHDPSGYFYRLAYYASIFPNSARMVILPGSTSILNCWPGNPLWVSQSPVNVSSPLSLTQSAPSVSQPSSSFSRAAISVSSSSRVSIKPLRYRRVRNYQTTQRSGLASCPTVHGYPAW